MPSVTPRAPIGDVRLWTGYSGPVYSPTPLQDIYGAAIVQKVIKAVTVSSPIEGVMQRGTILAWDPGTQKHRIVNAPDDELYGVLIEDLNFVADETGTNIVDVVGAVAKTGNFRAAALITGPGTPPGSLTVDLLVPALRLIGLFTEGIA